MHGTAEAEDRSLNQCAGVNLMPFEDCSSRLNRLIDMQERLMEANRISLQSKTNKQKRSTLVVNASNSGQVISLFHLNICYCSIKLR
jgi:hypothetical protein